MDGKPKKKRRFIFRPKILFALCLLALLIFFGYIFKLPPLFGSKNEMKTVTSSQLEKVINISELSTSQFVYGGIAQVYKEDDSSAVNYNICYQATVKAGIEMDKITFEIDDRNKTVRPVLPEITIHNISVDPSSLGYIPESADVDLQKTIKACEEDAENESEKNENLCKAAEDNAKTAVEALISPVLEPDGYTIVW